MYGLLRLGAEVSDSVSQMSAGGCFDARELKPTRVKGNAGLCIHVEKVRYEFVRHILATACLPRLTGQRMLEIHIVCRRQCWLDGMVRRGAVGAQPGGCRESC